jgi:hypothetical protein
MEETFEKVLNKKKEDKCYDFASLRFAITPFDAEDFE